MTCPSAWSISCYFSSSLLEILRAGWRWVWWRWWRGWCPRWHQCSRGCECCCQWWPAEISSAWAGWCRSREDLRWCCPQQFAVSGNKEMWSLPTAALIVLARPQLCYLVRWGLGLLQVSPGLSWLSEKLPRDLIMLTLQTSTLELWVRLAL